MTRENGVETELYKRLAPICGRVRRRRMLRCVSTGLLWGVAAALPIGLWRLAADGGGSTGWPLSIAGLAVLVIVPIAVAARAALRPITPAEAARRVDRHYGLSDRTVTALFLADGPDCAVARLQLSDAMRQLERVEPNRVVPIVVPRALLPAVFAAGLAVALAVWPVDARRPSIEDDLAEPAASTAADDPWEPADGTTGRKIAGRFVAADLPPGHPGSVSASLPPEPTTLDLDAMIDQYFDAPQ